MTSPEFSLGHNKELRLARPQASASASASEEGLRLARPWASASASASGEASASPDLGLSLGGVAASPDPGLGPTMLQGIHHYPTPS